MKFKDFKELVDENPRISHIELSSWGEMFLNPDLPSIIEYAHEKRVALTAENGANLNDVTDEALEALVRFKFRHMVCSIDGASNEIYGVYRQGGEFGRVIENIRKINGFKLAYGSKFPMLTWQFVVFGHNEHEIPLAKKMAADLDMRFVPRLSFDARYSPIKNAEFVREQTGHDVLSQEGFRRKHGKPYRAKWICAQLWNNPQINWDGRNLGCCRNFWGDYGNVFESGLTRSFGGEKIDYARQMLLGKKEAREDIPCSSCIRYEEMKRYGSFLSMRDVFLIRWLERVRKGFPLATRLGIRFYPYVIKWF